MMARIRVVATAKGYCRRTVEGGIVRRRRILLATALIAGCATTGLVATTTAGAGQATPSFGTPVAANFWVPGFEPDVAIDRSPGSHPLYTTWPNGFSTTISFNARSDDGGRSFHFVEGNVLGKPLTCAGGGDSEITISPVDGKLYFADLQGLTNFSNSVSADHGHSWDTSCAAVPIPAVDRQWLSLDTNGGTSSVGAAGTDGRAYFTYDNIAQNPTGGNTLVMNESVDGVHFGSGCALAGVPCPGAPAVISPSEGLPGNTLVDNTPGSPYQHSVYVAHNNADGDAAVISYCRGASTPKTAASVANDCTTPPAPPANPLDVNANWHDVLVSPADPKVTVEAFVVVAMDTAGNLYMTWAQYPFDATNGVITGPGKVMFASSRTTGAGGPGATWSKPVQVNPKSLHSPVQPWIAAGDPGRVDIAYYAAPESGEDKAFGPDSLTKTGTWNVYLDQSLDALTTPHFTHTLVSDHQVKFGNISTQGLGGSSDRSLGDYMQVQTGRRGEALLSYVDDTSENRNPDFTFGSGQSPSEAAGPTMVAVQTGGPSLYKSVGTVTGDNRRPYGKVTDPTGQGFPDAYLGLLGTDTNGPANLDIGRVTITQADSQHLRITMSTADKNLANDLSVPLSLGGKTADWIVRWAAPSYHKSNGQGGYLGDGDMFYVGMESTRGGTPKYFTGSTDSLNTTHAKYFIYTPKKSVPGSISGSTVTWTVPLADVGSPPKGAGLFSVTGFTSTQLLPSEPSVSLINGGVLTAYTPPNLIDAAAPTAYTVGKLTPGVPGSTRPPGAENSVGSLATTGLPVAVPIVALGLVTLAAIVRRRRISSRR
jgi:hypothetical protein